MDSEIIQNTISHWFKLLRFFVLEIILFVSDVGTDVYSAIEYRLDEDVYWAVATTVCILLPSIPRFFSFFGDKVNLYRRDAEERIIIFPFSFYFKLLFWICSFPIFLVISTLNSNFQESILLNTAERSRAKHHMDNLRLSKPFAKHSEMKMPWLER